VTKHVFHCSIYNINRNLHQTLMHKAKIVIRKFLKSQTEKLTSELRSRIFFYIRSQKLEHYTYLITPTLLQSKLTLCGRKCIHFKKLYLFSLFPSFQVVLCRYTYPTFQFSKYTELIKNDVPYLASQNSSQPCLLSRQHCKSQLGPW
jgi:hypothetical protein